ncbi:MAG: RsmB/NOP family class I SAM-dependent RNA methyltransferase [Bacillota bacterium]
MAIPKDFARRMRQLLGGEAEQFLASLIAPEHPALRVNTLKVDPLSFVRRSPFPVNPVPWSPEGFVVPDEEARPSLHPYHFAGVYYLQDPAAMLAAELLDPHPGEWVLDLCAAPGGKASHLAARMGNLGVLVANDPDRQRVTVLARNLERMGVTCAVVLYEEPARLAARFPGFFDRVLVDAPCSGESTFGNDAIAKRSWSVQKVAIMARLQRRLLSHAAALVRPGGWLLYATCTFSPEENEDVVGAFLSDHSDFHVADIPSHPCFDRGHPEWAQFPAPDLDKAIRLWPHRGPGKGHFYALLQREGDEHPVRPRHCSSLAPDVGEAYHVFCDAYLRTEPAEQNLVVWKNGIYSAPIPQQVLDGLRVLRPGWWLGTVKHGRFVPDHALALGLKGDQVKQVLRLSPSDPRVRAYLRGEEICVDAIQGWVLVMVEEFPLGWGWVRHARLRNFYPRHWRLLS